MCCFVTPLLDFMKWGSYLVDLADCPKCYLLGHDQTEIWCLKPRADVLFQHPQGRKVEVLSQSLVVGIIHKRRDAM